MSDSGTSGPIFIVGGSRTGSELHRTILTHSPRIDLVEEMWLLCPPWLHTDFATHLERSVGPLTEQGAIDRLMDLMYSKKPFGYFWSVIDRDLAPEALRAALLQSEPTLRGVFDAILTVHAQAKGKPIRGAKFPVHYSHVDLLVEWFPDCKIIHTVRDPRAVYASQASKYVRPRQALYERARLRLLHFMHIAVQSWWTARIHTRMQGSGNYFLSRYEDLVTDPLTRVRSLCAFLGVEVVPEMSNPLQYNSSYRGERGLRTGFSTDSLIDWRKRLNPLTTAMIGLINRHALKTLGYA